MLINNIAIILQFVKEESDNKRKNDTYKLYLKLDKMRKNLNTNDAFLYKLYETELYEEDSFKDSCAKILRKNCQTDNFKHIKSNHYDNYRTMFDERVLQCSNICILNENKEIDENWFEVLLDTNKLILKNEKETIKINFVKENFVTRITSANTLLFANHSIILIEALLQLKALFYYSDIVFDYLDDEFLISDIAAVLNVFSEKPFSKSTIRRRFNRMIEKKENESSQAKVSVYCFKKF